MLTRTKKKITYGAIYVVVFFAVIALVTIPGRGPSTTPTPSPTSMFIPIDIEQVTVIPHAIQANSPTRTVDIVASLKNSNLRAGVSNYPLKITLLDTSGNEIITTQETTYILPGARHFITALGVSFPVDSRLGRAEITPPENVQFISLPDQLEPPRFNLFLRDRTEKTIGNQVIEEQTGIVTNTSTLDWERVEVTAIGRDATGSTVAAGRTFVGRLAVGEQREFTLQWPRPSSPVIQVIALPSTNMFNEDNIVDIIGDPATLR